MRSALCIVLPVLIWLACFSKNAQGQQIFKVICRPTLGNTEVDVWVNLARGRFIYISGCNSMEGEYGGSGVPSNLLNLLSFTLCNISLDVRHQLYLTEIQGIVRGNDTINDFTCQRVTGFVNASTSFTVNATGNTNLNTSTVTSPVFMKLTDRSSNYTGSALTSAPVGSLASLHIWTNDVYTDNPSTGIDVRAGKIWVDAGSTSAVVVGIDGTGTYEGCKTLEWCCDVVRVAPGYVRMDFQIFYMSSTHPQIWSANIDTCTGEACPAYDCTQNGAGGSGSQFGRRRRDISSDVITGHVHISTTVQVTLESEGNATYNLPSPLKDVNHDQKASVEIGKCEDCQGKTEIHVVIGLLAAAIFVIAVVNGVLYFKSRGDCTFKSPDFEKMDNGSESGQKNNDVDIKEP